MFPAPSRPPFSSPSFSLFASRGAGACGAGMRARASARSSTPSPLQIKMPASCVTVQIGQCGTQLGATTYGYLQRLKGLWASGLKEPVALLKDPFERRTLSSTLSSDFMGGLDPRRSVDATTEQRLQNACSFYEEGGPPYGIQRGVCGDLVKDDIPGSLTALAEALDALRAVWKTEALRARALRSWANICEDGGGTSDDEQGENAGSPEGTPGIARTPPARNRTCVGTPLTCPMVRVKPSEVGEGSTPRIPGRPRRDPAFWRLFRFNSPKFSY